MGVGKYSPTVANSYRQDQNWWEKNGGDFGKGKNPESVNDDEGYDQYGYSGDGSGPDRAGVTEAQYADGYTEFDGERTFYLYDRVGREWARLFCGTKYVSTYPAITGLIAETVAPEVFLLCSSGSGGSYLEVHGYVAGEVQVQKIVEDCNAKLGRRSEYQFWYESAKPLSRTVDQLVEDFL